MYVCFFACTEPLRKPTSHIILRRAAYESLYRNARWEGASSERLDTSSRDPRRSLDTFRTRLVSPTLHFHALQRCSHAVASRSERVLQSIRFLLTSRASTCVLDSSCGVAVSVSSRTLLAGGDWLIRSADCQIRDSGGSVTGETLPTTARGYKYTHGVLYQGFDAAC